MLLLVLVRGKSQFKHILNRDQYEINPDTGIPGIQILGMIVHRYEFIPDCDA